MESNAVAVALSTPRVGEKLLTWTEVKPDVWFCDDDIFQIGRTENADYPFRLEVKTLGDKYCGIGPFHTFAAAMEAAERIWAGLLNGKIHYSQIGAFGYVAVASKVVFPNL
jgi:hypothetical protein